MTSDRKMHNCNNNLVNCWIIWKKSQLHYLHENTKRLKARESCLEILFSSIEQSSICFLSYFKMICPLPLSSLHAEENRGFEMPSFRKSLKEKRRVDRLDANPCERREGNYPCFRELGRAMLVSGNSTRWNRARCKSRQCFARLYADCSLTKNVRVNWLEFKKIRRQRWSVIDRTIEFRLGAAVCIFFALSRG